MMTETQVKHVKGGAGKHRCGKTKGQEVRRGV